MKFNSSLDKENKNQNLFFNQNIFENNPNFAYQLIHIGQKQTSFNEKNKQLSAINFQLKLKFIKKQTKLKKKNLLNQKHVRQALREITQKIKKQLKMQNQQIFKQNMLLPLQKKQNIQPIFDSSARQIFDSPVRQIFDSPARPIQDCTVRSISDSFSGPMFYSPVRQYEDTQQFIKLQSKLKRSQIIYPIFEDKCIKSKNLNSLIIQRQLDNDVSSDQQQMQAGICHLYCELLTSQKKQSQFKRQLGRLQTKQISKVQQRLFR